MLGLKLNALPGHCTAGASPNDSEDEDAVVVLSEHPAPSAPAPIVDLQQEVAVPLVNGPRSASAPAQTASQQQSAVRGAGSEPAGLVPAQTASQLQRPAKPVTADRPAPAQTAQRADSDEDADTWEFMTLPPPSTRAQQPSARDSAPLGTPSQAPADRQQPSLHGTGIAADAPRAGGTGSKPSFHEWEAELEPQDCREGGRAAAAVIAAATIAAAGDALSLFRQGSRHQHTLCLIAVA